jgi:hypothetical protein
MTNTVKSNETEVKTAATKNIIKREDLTVEFVRQRLTLDKETGYFYLNEDTRILRKGDFAGTIRAADLYYSVVLAGTVYSGKLLAYFYLNGKWPEKTVAEPKAKEPKAHTPRMAPVITPEAIEAAKAEAAAKKAALKAKKENPVATPVAKTVVTATHVMEDADF